MSKRPFRILYRDFLFRVVDRELLSPHGTGDAHSLFTQIAAILVVFSVLVSIPALDSNAGFSPAVRLFFAWRFEHFLIATTMLAAGLFATLSWETLFPDRRDVLVLAPLPVAARTILLAKVAAVATALCLAVVAMNVVAGLIWPISLNRPGPAIAMPSLGRDAAMPPVVVADLQNVLDRDLASTLVNGWLAPGAGGGLSVAVSRHGVRRVLTYGAARPDSIFQIGSVTKTFTAFALARTVQDGRARLDAPIRNLLPAAGIPPRPGQDNLPDITLLDLATHRSGLPTMPAGVRPDRGRSPFAAFGTSDLHAYLLRHGVEKPPHTRFLYSNLGFGLLGHVLAIGARTDYATLIRQLVTEPLRLPDTGVNLSLEQRARVLQGYDDEGRPVDPWEFDVLAGAGAMFSTAPDLLTWLEAHLHPAGPLAPAFELTQHPLAAARGDSQIGLAWLIDPATASVSHEGAVGGYTADAFFSPQDDLALVVLANRGPGVVAEAPRVAAHIRARLSGRPAVSLNDVAAPATGGIRRWLRTLFAYWFTMFAASAFVAGLLVGVQGLAAALLPRRYFLRASSVLQFAAFAVLVGGYLLQPIGFVVDDLVAAQVGGPFSASPSYWFLGLFHWLDGSSAMEVLAGRAWTGLVLAVALASLAYGVSYLRTLRGIVEEPDPTATVRAGREVRIGGGPVRGIAGFALKTLFRSAQPRVVMAFYWGLGLALAVAFVKTPRGQELSTATDAGAWYETGVPLLVASMLMMCASILAARSAFAMPRDISANWIFRALPLRQPRAYATARRRAFLAVSVVPVSVMSALAFFCLWPWPPAWGHVVALVLFGLTLVEIVECGDHRIPFACSYLPGRSRIHIAVVVIVLLVIPLVVGAATLELEALQDAGRYAALLATLSIAWAAARCRTIWLASDVLPAFDAEPEERPVTLELWDSRLASPSGRRSAAEQRA